MANEDKNNGGRGNGANGGSGDSGPARIQTHIAEYEALTTRATYLQSLQVGMLTLIVISVGVAFQVIKSLDAFLGHMLTNGRAHPGEVAAALLIVMGFIQIFAIVWSVILSEQYHITLYLERNLRERLPGWTADESFWGYESFMAERRKHFRAASPAWTEHMVLLVVTAFVGVVAFIAWSPSCWDRLGVGIDGFLWASLTCILLIARKTRHEWERAIRERQK